MIISETMQLTLISNFGKCTLVSLLFYKQCRQKWTTVTRHSAVLGSLLVKEANIFSTWRHHINQENILPKNQGEGH